MFRRSTRGYRREGRGGCSAWLVWLGILLNVGVIFYSVNESGGFSLSSIVVPTADASEAARRAFQNGDLETSIERARSALAANPEDSQTAALLTRALIYYSYADFGREAMLVEASEVAAQAVQQQPSDPDTLAAQAFALQANGDVNPSVQLAERVLADHPQHSIARTTLALAYARAGNFTVALQQSQQALQDADDTVDAFDARRAVAISTADLGNYQQAGNLLDSLIDDYDAMVPLYYERALYARQISQIEVAENAYLRVLQLQPSNIKASLRLCELTEGEGERVSAEEYCRQVTQRAPTLPAGWYRLGRLHFLDGNFSEAQRTLNRCSSLQVLQNVSSEQRIFECWYMQGQAAEILGDCAGLIATYEQFQNIAAADPTVRQTWTYPPEGPPMCVGDG